MSSEKMELSQIHIKISAENGKLVLKEDTICVDKHSSESGDAKNCQNQSYLSSLSNTLKSMRHDTNSLLTQYINNNSTSNVQADPKDEMEDDDSSDSDNTG